MLELMAIHTSPYLGWKIMSGRRYEEKKMSAGGWKKYKQKKIKGVDGKTGYIFNKRIYYDNNNQGHLYLPKRLGGVKATIIIIPEDEEVIEENKEEEIDPFK